MGKYYVYTLADLDGTVFYVGKGKGNRIHFHEEAAMGKHYDVNQRKCAIIRAIQAQGKQVVTRKVYETDIEQDAYLYEWILIHLIYGVENLTNIVKQAQENVPDLIAIKLDRQAHRQLKTIAALSHETMYVAVERLVDAEFARIFT